MLDCSRNQDLTQRRKDCPPLRLCVFALKLQAFAKDLSKFVYRQRVDRGPVKIVSVSPLPYVLFDLTMEIATPAIGQSFNLYSAP